MTAPSLHSDRPRIRLKPKADARAIRHGGPWNFTGEVVTDRRMRALSPGTLAVPGHDRRSPLRLVATNLVSKTIARMPDRDPGARIDRARPARATGPRADERIARLAAPGGYQGLWSCSHGADLARFRGASGRGIGRAGRAAQLIRTGFAGPDHPQLAETGHLTAPSHRL